MSDTVLLSTAYLPPVEYFHVINSAQNILIEAEESYSRQTYRNRCNILSSGGTLLLSVPVVKVVHPVTPVREAEIDYSKRWQQVHLRALVSCYNTSPYFQFYFDRFESIILKNHRFVFDLNMDLLLAILEMLGLKKRVSLTTRFESPDSRDYDYRYRITPRAKPGFSSREYSQVFGNDRFFSGLSVIDLLFNMGPDSVMYL